MEAVIVILSMYNLSVLPPTHVWSPVQSFLNNFRLLHVLQVKYHLIPKQPPSPSTWQHPPRRSHPPSPHSCKIERLAWREYHTAVTIFPWHRHQPSRIWHWRRTQRTWIQSGGRSYGRVRTYVWLIECACESYDMVEVKMIKSTSIRSRYNLMIVKQKSIDELVSHCRSGLDWVLTNYYLLTKTPWNPQRPISPWIAPSIPSIHHPIRRILPYCLLMFRLMTMICCPYEDNRLNNDIVMRDEIWLGYE